MKNRIPEFMARHSMAEEGERILCAVSGGADSMALLHLLASLGTYEIFCAHFNHKLRGAESDRDEAFVRDYCEKKRIPFRSGGADVAAWASEHRCGTEEAARVLRYAFLEETAEALGCGRVATAHNAEDNAETVLMNLVRGAGARGLSGIPPVRGNLIRPLLRVTRREILEYLDRNGVPHVEDSSNASDVYQRNRVRHRLLPLLRELNPGAVEHINAAAELLRADEAYLNEQAERLRREITRERDGGLSVPALLDAPEALALRLLRNLCPGASRAQLEGVYAGLCGDESQLHAARSLPGRRVYRDRDWLYVLPLREEGPETAEAAPDAVLAEGILTPVPGTGRALRLTRLLFTEEIHSSFNTFYFNYDNICGTILAGHRRPGDSLRIAGRGCTKSLKKLYTEAKLPLSERSRRLVLRDDAGVLAAEGFGIAERCAPVPGKEAARVEILPF